MLVWKSLICQICFPCKKIRFSHLIILIDLFISTGCNLKENRIKPFYAVTKWKKSPSYLWQKVFYQFSILWYPFRISVFYFFILLNPTWTVLWILNYNPITQPYKESLSTLEFVIVVTDVRWAVKIILVTPFAHDLNT